MKKLPRSFYSRKTISIAKALLGTIIVRRIGRITLTGMIVETEAYLFDDPASHSYRGITERNKVMFGEPGHLYVYFTYGMHYCANVVTNSEGIGEAVLIRAVQPMSGIQTMTRHRSAKKVIDAGRTHERSRKIRTGIRIDDRTFRIGPDKQ
jgi:DNA-3-methyladenine glycosylase